MEKEQPIHDFSGLKELLRSLGYKVGEAIVYKELKIADIDINELNKLQFNDDGIYYLDETTGLRFLVFLYKRNYSLAKYGKPRFHIRKCQTIQDFINSGSFEAEYRRANTKSVTVCDNDDRRIEKVVTDLPLCKYCLKMISNEHNIQNSTDFVEILKLANDNSGIDNSAEVDIFGYVKRWESISIALRTSKDFTCEICGLHISDKLDQFYMHTHHKNGNKLDNRVSNLQCLCIECHSNIDENHKMRLTTGANKVTLDFFKEKYRKNR